VALGRHLEPARGVYATVVTLADGSRHPSVTNIGRRPTVATGTESRLETHLFDFSGDLYGQTVRVELHHFLRDEQKFAGIEALKAQIALDAAAARAVLDHPPGPDAGGVA
jgi:riboflavin kinase/FMN adenylyltransferase